MNSSMDVQACTMSTAGLVSFAAVLNPELWQLYDVTNHGWHHLWLASALGCIATKITMCTMY